MSEFVQRIDDEIDLFELIATIWDGKWLVSAFVLFAVLCGGGFLLIKNSEYESKLSYSIDNVPPFYSKEKASSDFRKAFYSNKIFDDWKKTNKNTSIGFDDFSTTKTEGGFVITKDESDRIAILVSEVKRTSFVLVRTNQLSLISDFFKYANHVSDVLKSDYAIRARDELNTIDAILKSLSAPDTSVVQSLLAIDRYIDASNKGAKVVTIQHPTMPQKVSPKSALILAMSVMIGGMIGVTFVVVRNAIRKRKIQQAQA